ncbi:MAG: hypothetical protein ACRD12_08160 [Acidimicrobiales bacterium]
MLQERALKSAPRGVDTRGVIDIDLLDERLVDALDADLRVIRRGDAPAPVAPPAPAAPRRLAPVPPPRPAVVRPAKAPKAAKGLKAAKAPKPAKAGALAGPTPGAEGRWIADLLRQGRLADADHHIALHAAHALESRDPHRRHDAATWATMRALLDGNEAKARGSLASARTFGTEAGDPDTADRYWAQRFWIALEWGSEAEQSEALDHCRERAYRYDDIEWRGPLTLALARLGRTDEAQREFDLTFEQLRRAARVDLMCTLAEAAGFLGDPQRAAKVQHHLDGSDDTLVVLNDAWVCIGALARYQAHAAAGMGAWARADERFGTAVELHGDLQARPLMARTLREWGCSLIGRDNARARAYIRESHDLASRLGLAGLVTPTRAIPAA